MFNFSANGGVMPAPSLSSQPVGPGATVTPLPFDGVLDRPETLDDADGDAFGLLTGGRFALEAWDAALRAQPILAEFAANAAWMKCEFAPPDDRPATLRDEVDALLSLREQRQERLAEIVAQAEEPQVYWASLLQCGRGARPETAVLVATGMAVGQLVGMYWKYRYQRARPAQVFPALLPVIPTPPHPSYPSNHALQAFLVAEILHATLPPALAGAMRSPIDELAQRIAENREIAGVHFLSDTQVSRLNAKALAELLHRSPTFAEVQAAARAEWAGLAVHPEPPSNLGAVTRAGDRIAQDVAGLLSKHLLDEAIAKLADAVASEIGRRDGTGSLSE